MLCPHGGSPRDEECEATVEAVARWRALPSGGVFQRAIHGVGLNSPDRSSLEFSSDRPLRLQRDEARLISGAFSGLPRPFTPGSSRPHPRA